MMKHKPMMFVTLLAVLILLLSGCDLSQFGELIPDPGTGTPTDSINGIVLGIEPFVVESPDTQITLQGLATGQQAILAISPWNTATLGGVYYDVQVSLERMEMLSLNGQALGGSKFLLSTPQTDSLFSDSLYTGIPERAMPGTGSEEVRKADSMGGSEDYYTHLGDPAGLTTATVDKDDLTLQDTSRWFYVKTGGVYEQVRATLIRDGLHIAVYVDDAVQVGTDYIEQIVHTFNYTIYPKVTDTFTDYWDKDGNGKVLLLITPLRHNGSDTNLIGYFDEVNLYDQTEPYSNAADMFYLNANVIGTDMNTIYSNLAHEFQHLIFAGAKLQAWRDHEKGARFSSFYSDIWINEGFSMLASHLTGYANLGTDPRIYDSTYGYFAQPHRDGLLTWDDRRLESNYGSAGLFAYYLYDHYRGVIEEILTGSGTVEMTMEQYVGKEFAFVFRNWMIANMVDGWSNVTDRRHKYSSLNLRSTPAVTPLMGEDVLGIWSTGVKYYLITGNDQDIQLTFSHGNPGGAQFSQLQAALIFFKPVP